ncbi:universal stress protein [Pendulispora brunnea]|uniref:Universal stress protein n=1 Tax=Pendulispora brunnea TaxID=2905690 RepID=A0ABZ2JZ23_9BACT
MVAFKQVLLAIDFEETSPDVIEMGVEVARRFDAQLIVLHAFCVYPPPYMEGFYLKLEKVLHDARATLDRTVTKIRERYPKVEGVLVQGEPWEEIPRLAKKYGADLIVMGTHGRRGLPRLFLGSVAERVVRLSNVPVLTVASPREGHPHSVDGPSQVVRAAEDAGAEV